MPTLKDKADKRADEFGMEVLAAARQGRIALRRADAVAVDGHLKHIEEDARHFNAARNAGRETYLPRDARGAIWQAGFDEGIAWAIESRFGAALKEAA